MYLLTMPSLKSMKRPARRCGAVLAIACALFISGCAKTPDRTPGDVKLSGERVAKSVVIAQDATETMQVEYRSSLSIRNCEAMHAEVRELWATYVRTEAERFVAVEVLIWPSDDSNEARAYSMKRGAKTTWIEATGFAPC